MAITDIIGTPLISVVGHWELNSDLIRALALAPVAIVGTYASLYGPPINSTVGHGGNHSGLLGAPALSTVALSNNNRDLNNLPALQLVATTSTYQSLTGQPNMQPTGK